MRRRRTAQHWKKKSFSIKFRNYKNPSFPFILFAACAAPRCWLIDCEWIVLLSTHNFNNWKIITTKAYFLAKIKSKIIFNSIQNIIQFEFIYWSNFASKIVKKILSFQKNVQSIDKNCGSNVLQQFNMDPKSSIRILEHHNNCGRSDFKRFEHCY